MARKKKKEVGLVDESVNTLNLLINDLIYVRDNLTKSNYKFMLNLTENFMEYTYNFFDGKVKRLEREINGGSDLTKNLQELIETTKKLFYSKNEYKMTEREFFKTINDFLKVSNKSKNEILKTQQ